VRAIVPLSKGTEIFFQYQPSLEDRAGRRESLERYGFMCGLPDDLSNALDKKIKLVKDADDYWYRFIIRKEHDAIRAIQLVAILMSITIRERLFFDYAQFYLPLNLLCFFPEKQLYSKRFGKPSTNATCAIKEQKSKFSPRISKTL
jgi:hypothetical protein